MEQLDRCNDADRAWVTEAIRKVEADANRSADTHLLPFPLPPSWGIDLYLKDESVHPTGSLKHRLARSLFLYGLCNGWIGPRSTIVEASSGSTAISEAYFARMLGLPFVAVMPAETSPEKIAQIEFHGGKPHLVRDPAAVVVEARWLAEDLGGHFMDQFTYAERATDWRGNNNIAESIFAQLALERHPIPHWIVVGAGTGGTSATIGRYVRFQRHRTKVCVVDPENSAFYPAWCTGDWTTSTGRGSMIEGIGRPTVEPSFQPSVVDRMIQVPDAASLAVMRIASELLGRRVGGSTGTNLWGAFALIAELRRTGQQGSVVTLLCDSGERYTDSYFSADWLARHGLDLAPHLARARHFLAAGDWPADD
ncbi:PLP-dependent cysteine synthase family protein [Micromonospora sp. NBC_01813]|uniref:PLP-dependent cysteine synthase family protein n=1 Tax=Micromonospora sp. NBC_01813 TaxID=2975988 RepID=UPI002DD8C726|nr:PLP-dependent cysteine synthase family protein [Micromonospora sp. NBC_01813]WSA07758.1 PLP-dependent cysteine synthase family protein [Micromonospora sp. NBC_01813]